MHYAIIVEKILKLLIKYISSIKIILLLNKYMMGYVMMWVRVMGGT